MAAEYDASPGRLGRAAALRFTLPTQLSRAASARRPGAGVAAMGQVGASARRFAAGLARPPEVRRLLAEPGSVRVKSFDAVSRPPRWWVPTLPEPGAAPVARASAADLPARGLQRVMGPPPSEKTHVPGRFASTMRSQTVKVRRLKEVAEIGSLGSTTPKLTTPVRRSMAARGGSGPHGGGEGPDGHARPARSGAGPGHAPGDGDAHRSESGAVPHTARGFTGRESRPPSRALERTGVLRRAWAGRTAAGTGSTDTPAAAPWSPGVPSARPSLASIAPSPDSGSPPPRAPLAAAPSTARPDAAARQSGIPEQVPGSASASVSAPVRGRPAAGSLPTAASGPSPAPTSAGALPSGRIVAVPRPSPGGVLHRLLGRSRPAMTSAADLGAPPTAALGGLSRAVALLPGPDSPREVRVRRLTDTLRPPTGFAPASAPSAPRPGSAGPGDGHAPVARPLPNSAPPPQGGSGSVAGVADGAGRAHAPVAGHQGGGPAHARDGSGDGTGVAMGTERAHTPVVGSRGSGPFASGTGSPAGTRHSAEPSSGAGPAAPPTRSPLRPGVIARRFFGTDTSQPDGASRASAAVSLVPAVRRSMTTLPATADLVAPASGRLMESAPVGGAPVLLPGPGTARGDAAAASHTPDRPSRPAPATDAAVSSAAGSAGPLSHRHAPHAAGRGPVVRRSMTGFRAPLWRAAASAGAVNPATARLVESAPVTGSFPVAAAHRVAAGAGANGAHASTPGAHAAGALAGTAPTTVTAMGVPRVLARPSVANPDGASDDVSPVARRSRAATSFAPGATAALASARVAGLSMRSEVQDGSSEPVGSFRIRRMPHAVAAPSPIRSAATGATATAPAAGPAAARTHAVRRRTAPRLAVSPLPLRTAPDSAAVSQTAAPQTASSAPLTRLAAAGAPAAPGVASAAPASTTWPGARPLPAGSPPPAATAPLRRFGESTGGVAGAITPATVSLMRQSPIAPPAGVVSRAPGTAAPGAVPPSAALRSMAGDATGSAAPAASASGPARASAPESSVIRRFLELKNLPAPFGRKRSNAVGSSGAPPRPTTPAPAQRPSQQPVVVDADPSPTSIQPISTQLTAREWAELVEEVTRRIEDRVTAELSRRGRRNLPRPM